MRQHLNTLLKKNICIIAGLLILQNTWPPPSSFCFWIHDGDSGNCGPSRASFGRGLGGGGGLLGRFSPNNRGPSFSRLSHLRHCIRSESQTGKTIRIRGDLERFAIKFKYFAFSTSSLVRTALLVDNSFCDP